MLLSKKLVFKKRWHALQNRLASETGVVVNQARPVRLGLSSPIIPVNEDLSRLYLPRYLEWSSRLRLQSFL